MLDPKLDTFLAIVSQGSYTAAANALHLTQPAVTQHIQKLEEYYGCRLFVQQGRTMSLTEQGHLFYQYVQMQQSNEQLLFSKLNHVPAPLLIGSTLSIADYYLPSLLPPLSPEQEALHIRVANTHTLLNELQQGKLDAAFVEGNFDRSMFSAQVFCYAPFIAVASAGHPLAHHPVSLSDLHSFPLLLREEGSGTRDILEGYLTQQNDSVESFLHLSEISSFILLKRILERSQAVSFLYEAVATNEIAAGKLVKLELTNYCITHPLHFVCLKNRLDLERITTFYQRCQQQADTAKKVEQEG